ncbi:Coatomer subunit beta'-3 [Linum perenne]
MQIQLTHIISSHHIKFSHQLCERRKGSMAFKIEKTFYQASERVKSADFHTTEPWILLSLHTGQVCIWNHHTHELVKSFKVTDSPVRTAKFIPRKKWVVTGADDGKIRVYDEESFDLVKEFEAHQDFIRSVCVHPTLPVLISASDDKAVKQWDWEKDWECTHVYEGHSHYVMQVVFNPVDPESFATASLDNSVKLWNLGSSVPVGSLEGHVKGVNSVDYLISEDDHKQYLLSGSDDLSVKVWDLSTKSCVESLEGSHTNNVSAVVSHPELPIFISGSEDGTINIWDATTFKVIETLNYELERVWAVCCKQGSKQVGFGCDKGTVLVDVTSL